MSDIVEKTLSSIPKFFSENLLGSALNGPPSPNKFAARGFQNFIRQVNRARTNSVKHYLLSIMFIFVFQYTMTVKTNIGRLTTHVFPLS